MALYENTIRLKGFLGKDPETKATAGGKTFTILSLATKASYKDKQTGEWVSRTEWHRIVCFNKPAEYAKDFRKGDYVEVEGELRSSEFDSTVGESKKKATVKRRSWEIRTSLVRKLTRPARQEPEKASENETFTEDDAA